MNMDKDIVAYLVKEGWTVVSEKPLELEHTDTSVATGRAAEMLVDLALLAVSNQKRRAAVENLQSLVKQGLASEDYIYRGMCQIVATRVDGYDFSKPVEETYEELALLKHFAGAVLPPTPEECEIWKQAVAQLHEAMTF